MAETSVRHIVFHLSKNSFGFYASPAPMPHSLLGCEQLTCFSLVGFQMVVSLNHTPVAMGLEASAAQWTSLAVLCRICGPLGNMTACAFFVSAASTPHVLPHRTNAVVFLLVIIEVLRAERVQGVSWTVLDVEPVVFHIGIRCVPIHKLVIFL